MILFEVRFEWLDLLELECKYTGPRDYCAPGTCRVCSLDVDLQLHRCPHSGLAGFGAWDDTNARTRILRGALHPDDPVGRFLLTRLIALVRKDRDPLELLREKVHAHAAHPGVR